MSEPSWEATRQHLIRRLREQAIHYGPTLVEPGVVTDVFIDPSQVTLRGDGLALIEALLVLLLREDRVEAVGGPARDPARARAPRPPPLSRAPASGWPPTGSAIAR